MSTNTFPNALKIATVIPLFKKGDREDVSNYRPISLLPVLSKILEGIMKAQIVSFFEGNSLLNRYQFGFRAGLCTTDAILSFVNQALECFERGLYGGAVFFLPE